MNEGSDIQRRSINRGLAARAGVAIGVLVIVAAILAPRSSTPPSSSPGATGSPTAAAVTTPAPSEEPWDDLLLQPYEPSAALSPDDVDSIGPAPDTTFTLRSLTATPAIELAAGLRIDPPTDYTVAAGATPDLAVVRPVTPLAAGLRYRFRLESPDGALAGVWAFVARAPVHVAGTLPGNLAVDVPTNTGIEVTFDQDGTTGFEGRFSIDPPVPGRIEQHDRTWAFVSDHPLAVATIYTVTVHEGVGVAGSSETLESDFTFRFETSAEKSGVPRYGLATSILEIRPGELPVVAMGELDHEDEGLPSRTSIDVTIHRLPTFRAVEAAGIALSGPDSWAQVSRSAVVATDGLPLVATAEAAVISTRSGEALRIPVELARGHYIATIVQPGPPVQLLLQVTDLSGFAQTATGTTVVWVNDLATGAGVVGATVSVVNGPSLGATGPGGLLRRATPNELRTDVTPAEQYGMDGESFRSANLLAISATDGRHLLLPLGATTSWLYGDGDGWWGGGGTNDWWLLFHTDRTTYRQTDTVHVYGVIRARTDRSVPDQIELRLHPAESEADTPIARVPVTATSRGVFSADIHLDDLPRTSYEIDLYVGSKRVSSLWIDVTVIRKPSYQIVVTTDRHAYLIGEMARVTLGVDFYDGTAVPGIDLKVGGFDSAATDTTDDLGSAGVTLRTTLEGNDPEGIFQSGIDVRPVNPEEGEISGSTYVYVAPSRAWLSGDGSVTGGRVVVDGTLTWTDMAALEAAGAAGTYLADPAGRPIGGGTVTANVIHLVPVRREIGRSYDFIEKKVVTEYEYDIKEVSLGTTTLTSATNGQFHLSVAAPVATDGYKVVLTASDPERRVIRKTLYVAEAYLRELHPRPYLDSTGQCYGTPRRLVDLGSPVSLTMHAGDGSVADGGRFLFLVTERGSVETTIQDVATFTRTLRDADLPGFDVRAIWLTDTGYAVSDVEAVVDPDDKAITIRLVPDRARYRPGQTVSIAVTTTNADGKPIAADVVIQGVDEKLYTLGQAFDFDPRGELLAKPSSGLLQSHRSHALPNEDEGGCGAEGGQRDDFRDVVTFQRIATDSSGRGSVSFELPDDLTSWHMSAVAVSGALDSGQASVLVPVGLPFFVDATLAPEYLTGDQAVLRVRAYGESLHAGDRVSFVVSAPSLGLAATTVAGVAFESVRLPLPAMTIGDHAIRIEGTATVNGTALSDVLIRTVHVIETRLGALVSHYEVLGSSFAPKGGAGLTRYVITDEGRGRFIRELEELASSTSARFDSSATAEMARRLLIDEFKVPEASLPTTGFDSTRYQNEGIALLPYASRDLFLSARAALVAGSQLHTELLRSALAGWETTSREQAIAALAGRAGLGDDVLGELRTFDAATLTVREQLWLALGLQAAGDEAGARTIERAVLEAHGERLGPWVRLVRAANPTQTLEADGLLLLLAARLGDPIAADVSSYLADRPSDEVVFPLEQLGFIQATLERLPRETARFAVTVAGERTEVDLPRGGGYTLVLTRGQRMSLRLEPLQGKLAVITTWDSPDVELPSAGNATVTRTVTPAGNAPDDRLVRVVYSVRFNSRAIKGCYRLTDLVPSGLAPITGGAGWNDGELGREVHWPYEVDGQRVSWCAHIDDRPFTYGYMARVVSPGTYRWEPSVIQAELYPTDGASISATTYTIR